MAASHVGKARAIKIESPNHIMHSGLICRAQAGHTADITINRVGKQSPRVFGRWVDKPGEIILVAFVMAAVPVFIRAAITGASLVSVVERPSRRTIRAIARLEMLDVAVCRCKASFAVTAQVLLFCLQRCLDWLIRGWVPSKIVPGETTSLPRQQLGWRYCFRVRPHRLFARISSCRMRMSALVRPGSDVPRSASSSARSFCASSEAY